MPTLLTRSWVRMPTSSTMPSTAMANVGNAPLKSVACPTSARLTSPADVNVRNMLMRVSTSLCVVLREARRLQCSVASSCARTAGVFSCSGAWSGMPPSVRRRPAASQALR